MADRISWIKNLLGHDQVPAYGVGGPEILTRNLEPALKSIFDYFGKMKRVVPYKQGSPSGDFHNWYDQHIKEGTTYPWRAGEDWRLARESQQDKLINAGAVDHASASEVPSITGRPYIPEVPPISDPTVRGAAKSYTGDEYQGMNEALRHFAQNPNKAGKFNPDTLENMYNNDWWRGNGDGSFNESKARYLAKWLQDQETELPFDIYRSSRFRIDPTKLEAAEAPQAHGRGIGSFSFNPHTAYGFGRDDYVPHVEWQSGDVTPAKVPFVTRIPQGTKVRGANVSEYSSNPQENEFLMAPFQGFDIQNSGLIIPRELQSGETPRLLMDAAPSGVYNPHTPQLYGEGGQYDDGGQFHPVLASTGPQIMRKGLDAALRHAMEYFGGLKSPTLPYKISDQPHIHPEIPHWANRFADTTWQPSASAAGSTDAQWLKSMRAAGIDVSKPLDVGHPIRSAIESYTGSEYDNMNGILRRFAGNPEKTSPDLGNNPGLDWWRRGELDPNLVRHAADYMPHVPKELNELSKYLQDHEFELPYDIYRGSRMRGFEGIENLLPEHGMPQVRGTGIGSFSYTPSTSYAFGQDQLKTPQPLHNLAEDWQKAENQMKVPSVVRIPQGTKVRGMNVAQYSGLPTESEVLMAPFQGFDVTGTNLISPAPYVHGSSPRLLLNAEPSGIYDPHSPIIYGKGGAVPGYAGGGLEHIVNYIRGISKPIKGYHVSPHDFDQFSSAHIGTGEGNKNFGHGLYFMESPSLRDRYLKDLGEQFSGQPIRQYDVDIHGDPRQFLSLDEPLNTQGTIGKRAADYLQAPKDWVLRPPDRNFPRMEDQVTDPAFSKFMSDEGAAGTRYFDSRSKQQGFGTQNYVTFPTMDDIIEITGKKAQGGQIPGYAEGGYDDDPSQRYSIPPGSFGLPTPPTPTFQVPIGKGQATVGSNYDMINKIIEAQLGYEHPVGSHGARLGVSGNFNKYIGEGGDQVKPNWGVGLRLNLPFAEGGQYDPYDDIAEAQRLMGAYK